MPPTTGNTLAPGYNSLTPAEAKGQFDLNRFSEHEQELETRVEVAPSDLNTTVEEQPTVAQLEAIAQRQAMASAHVALGQESTASARPVREGEINPDVDRQSIGVNAGAIDVIREDALARVAAASPEAQRDAARWN